MKCITFFIASLSSGGAEHQLVMLAHYLCERNYNVTIVTYADVQDHYSVGCGIKRVRIAEGHNKVMKFFAIFFFFLRLKTDVVISFGQRDNFFSLIPLMFRRKIKVIAGERNTTNGAPSIYERCLLAFLYKRANFIVPNSYTQRDYLVKMKPIWKDKIIPITNYTDLEVYNPGLCVPLEKDTLDIAIFSRMVKQKNCIRFADVVRRVVEKSNFKVKFHWYGNLHSKGYENEEYLNSLKQTIKDLGIECSFILHDHVKNVAEVMAIYDAVCLPSLIEGFSNTISEAICMGKIVLASDVSDNKIMVHDGKNGYLFDPLDVNDMCEKIIKFSELSVDQRIKMGECSRQIAQDLFDKNVFVSKYERLINS